MVPTWARTCRPSRRGSTSAIRRSWAPGSERRWPATLTSARTPRSCRCSSYVYVAEQQSMTGLLCLLVLAASQSLALDEERLGQFGRRQTQIGCSGLALGLVDEGDIETFCRVVRRDHQLEHRAVRQHRFAADAQHPRRALARGEDPIEQGGVAPHLLDPRHGLGRQRKVVRPAVVQERFRLGEVGRDDVRADVGEHRILSQVQGRRGESTVGLLGALEPREERRSIACCAGQPRQRGANVAIVFNPVAALMRPRQEPPCRRAFAMACRLADSRRRRAQRGGPETSAG